VSAPSAISGFETELAAWAATRADIHAVYLVGSHARGQARPDSDIDLVLLCEQPQAYLQDTTWLDRFGKPVSQQVEDYGRFTSLRVWYAGGREVEFGLTAPDWITEPLEGGTAEVIAGGVRVIYVRGEP
jgi:predicted nucleotidyltransferase